MKRHHFIVQGLAGAAVMGTGILACQGQTTQPDAATNPVQPEVTGRRLDPVRVDELVAAGHANLSRVKEILAEELAEQRRLGGLVLADRELALGDLETALGGASHMGQREIALYLLAQGTRIDAFRAAMIGYVKAIVIGIAKAFECPGCAIGHISALDIDVPGVIHE